MGLIGRRTRGVCIVSEYGYEFEDHHRLLRVLIRYTYEKPSRFRCWLNGWVECRVPGELKINTVLVLEVTGYDCDGYVVYKRNCDHLDSVWDKMLASYARCVILDEVEGGGALADKLIGAAS